MRRCRCGKGTRQLRHGPRHRIRHAAMFKDAGRALLRLDETVAKRTAHVEQRSARAQEPEARGVARDDHLRTNRACRFELVEAEAGYEGMEVDDVRTHFSEPGMKLLGACGDDLAARFVARRRS